MCNDKHCVSIYYHFVVSRKILDILSWESYYMASQCYEAYLHHLYASFAGILKMPENSVSETKKGVERSRFSLSLNRNNATYLSDGNTELEDSKKNSAPCILANKDNKENKPPPKRPFSSTYFNTLHAAKKLKTISEPPKFTGNITY